MANTIGLHTQTHEISLVAPVGPILVTRAWVDSFLGLGNVNSQGVHGVGGWYTPDTKALSTQPPKWSLCLAMRKPHNSW